MAQSLHNYNHRFDSCCVSVVEDPEVFVVEVDCIDLDIVSVAVSDYIQDYNYYIYLAFVDSSDSYSLHSHNYHICFHLDSGSGIVGTLVADSDTVLGSDIVTEAAFVDMAAVVVDSDIETVAAAVVAVAAAAEAVVGAS